MAELTDRLPLTDGTNRVLDMPATPSTLGAVLGFASDALDGYMNLRREETEKRRQRKKDEDAAREQAAVFDAIKGHDAAVDLVNQSARGFVAAQQSLNTPIATAELGPEGVRVPNTVETDTPGVFRVEDIDPSLQKAASTTGNEIINISAAIDQGRMPPITMRAALSGKFNQLIDQYPDQAEKILDIWKKMGIDTTLFREGKDLGDQLDENREAGQRQAEDERKFNQGMFELGAKALGETMASGGANGGPMSREEVTAHGLVVARQAHDFELEQRLMTMQTQRAGLAREERKELEDDRNKSIVSRLNNALYNGTNPVISMVQNIANSILKEPNAARQAEQWQSVGARLHSMIGNQVEQTVQIALQGGFTGDINGLRTTLTNQFKRVEDLFSGEFSVAQTHLKALQTIQTRLKIEGQQALPIYTTLKDLGFDPATMTGFIEGLSENPELATRLRDEIKGFNTDFGRDRASEHLMQVVRILRGESTLGYMSPSEARNKMPDLYNTTQALAKNYSRGLGGSPDMVMNGIGELSIAANSLTPSSGAAAHIVAVQGILGNNGVKALRKLSQDGGVDDVMATATIQAARAAGAHALNNFQANLARVNANSPYFKVLWDERNGSYKIDNSNLRRELSRAKRDVGSLRGAGAGLETGASQFARLQNAKAPEEMTRWVTAANTALNGVIALKDLDPTTPKGSDLELRNYYGRNITPESLKNQNHPTNVDSEINKQFEAIERTIDENLTSANRPVRMRSDPTASPGYKKLAEPIKAAASKYGVPEEIAVALINKESSFDPTAMGPVIDNPKSMHYGDRAMGLGQVMAATAREYGINDRSALGPEEQIDLALRYLSDLKKNNSGEDWKDALSRYFSGRPYAQAKKAGASDGFNDVIEYVESIL